MVWYSQLFKNVPEFVVVYTVKGFGIVNKEEVDVFLELSCFFDDSANVGNLISGSSVFSKSSFVFWKSMFRIMLKPSMQDFKHDLTSTGDDYDCLIVSIFFSTPFLGNWDED